MCLKCCSLPLLPPHAVSSRVCVTVQCLSIDPSVPDALCCRGFAVVRLASRRYQQIAARRSAPAIPQHYYDYYYTRLTASCRTTWVCQYWKAKTSLDLTEARDDGGLGWQWHQLDHMQTICTSLQTDNCANAPSLNFYWPDALPDTQPTVSKH